MSDQFADGKIDDEDTSELKMYIAADHSSNVVRIQFAKPIKWLAFDLDSVKALCRLLEEKAEELRVGP